MMYTILLPYLGAVVRRYLFDKSYEKDMLQESFVNFFQNINQYDQEKGLFHKFFNDLSENSSHKIIRQFFLN